MTILNNINTSFDSYAQLVEFYHANQEVWFQDVPLSIKRWFNANMAAPLGALLDKIGSQANTVQFSEIEPKVQTILQKNQFLGYFGYPQIRDTYSTTIPYQKLKPSDGRYFMEYVQKDLLARTEMPTMSSGLKKKMAESIFEVFVNAQMHSETEHIYTCGQFFPEKHAIEFCITDTGIGFKEKMRRRFDLPVSSLSAIRWALEDKHTTKQSVTGGIGLALLKEFVLKNKGTLQIVSDRGFFQLDNNGENAQLLPSSFPGSIINIRFKTNDTSNYRLFSENGTSSNA